MNVTDKMDLGWKLRQNAFPTVGAVACKHDLVGREPLGHQFDEFEAQFRPCAMVDIVLWPRLLPVLPLGQPLKVTVEPNGNRQGKGFGLCPERIDYEQTKNQPVVSSTDQGLGRLEMSGS